MTMDGLEDAPDPECEPTPEAPVDVSDASIDDCRSSSERPSRPVRSEFPNQVAYIQACAAFRAAEPELEDGDVAGELEEDAVEGIRAQVDAVLELLISLDDRVTILEADRRR